jgi:hypothetical protein
MTGIPVILGMPFLFKFAGNHQHFTCVGFCLFGVFNNSNPA